MTATGISRCCAIIRRRHSAGFLPTAADYRDPAVKELIDEKGWMVWPLIPFDYRTITDAPGPYPAAPSRTDWLGTDDQGRDVLARLIYGFRISVLFGLALTLFSSIVGVAAGAVQGYFGGLVDLGFQRFIEIWEGLPVLYLLIILATFVEPNFWWLLGLMLLFSWTALVGVVRAEFLRATQFRLCPRRAGTRRFRPGNHLAPRIAKRDGGDDHVSAVHPERLDHDTDLARFSRLRAAAGLGVARRIAGPGQGESAGAMARPYRLLRCWR